MGDSRIAESAGRGRNSWCRPLVIKFDEASAAKMTANGMQFTVTGLNSATHYTLTGQEAK